MTGLLIAAAAPAAGTSLDSSGLQQWLCCVTSCLFSRSWFSFSPLLCFFSPSEVATAPALPSLPLHRPQTLFRRHAAGVEAANQLRLRWLGCRYVLLLQAEAKLREQVQQRQQRERFWQRSKRRAAALFSFCRSFIRKDATDGGSISRSHPADACHASEGGVEDVSEQFLCCLATSPWAVVFLRRCLCESCSSNKAPKGTGSLIYYPAPSLPGFSVSLSSDSTTGGSSAMSYQEILVELEKLTGVHWAFTSAPLPEGCVHPRPFVKTRVTVATVASDAAAATRGTAWAVAQQVGKLLPSWRGSHPQRQQNPAPCYFASRDVLDKDLLSRFGTALTPKSVARLLSIFALSRRIGKTQTDSLGPAAAFVLRRILRGDEDSLGCDSADAAFEFVAKRNKEDLILLRQAAAGVEALEVLLQRSRATAELMRPLALQQQRLEQRYEALLLLRAMKDCETRRVQHLQQEMNATCII
ncbi:hypothetical protein cyc_01604 [Cyclospora cayetanensis]|uniref:Uncharacterized protein n=1 Tax=Cyclospora cayetanensis TaxID=88456 RepID=A0A1D3D912_9EIME|nr:hypothetical protein cyc_01604 [Cyclospora cayetanensis]